jgi:YD repeat-containing protein
MPSSGVANRLTERADHFIGRVYATSYGYDGNDRVSHVTYASGRTVFYGYDAGGRVQQVTDAAGTVYASNFTYHPSGAIAGYQLAWA